MGPSALFHGNPRACRAIQETLEVEARKRILRLLANVGCKGCDRSGITCFQLGERVDIALRGRVFVLFGPKRFQSTNGFRPTSEHQVSNRAPLKAGCFVCECRTHADAGAKLLVGGFEPRGNINGIAIGRVVEEAASSKIPDDCRSRMNADPSDPQRDRGLCILRWQAARGSACELPPQASLEWRDRHADCDGINLFRRQRYSAQCPLLTAKQTFDQPLPIDLEVRVLGKP